MVNKGIIYGPEPTVPVFEGTAGQQIYEALLKYQDLPEALINARTKQVLSYKNILETSCRLAQALLSSGFGQWSILSIYSESCLGIIYVIIACLYTGITIAPINFQYVKDELYHIINLSKPEIVFCSKKTLNNITDLQRKVKHIKTVVVIDLDKEINGVQSLDFFISGNPARFVNVSKFKPVEFDRNLQVAVILCSSGTTGFPKGVMVTHKNLVYRFAQAMEPTFRFVSQPGSTVLTFTSLFHAFGLLSLLDYILLGYRNVLLPVFTEELFLQCIQEYKIKNTRLVPSVMTFLGKSPLVNQYDLSSLQDIVFGGAPLSQDVIDMVFKRLKGVKEIHQCYGLTEAVGNVMMVPSGIYHKIGTVGKLVPHMAVKIVDVKTLRTLGPHSPGEIWIQGPTVTNGYIGNKKATEETIDSNGWLRTGDIGYYDDNGFFYIVDRLKELIKYKGYQVAPAELETVLLKHAKIEDAGVIGIPDKNAGELPAAFVVKKPGVQLTENEVMEFVASQMSSQKRLRGGVNFITRIPRNASGKIIRRQLKKLMNYHMSKL